MTILISFDCWRAELFIVYRTFILLRFLSTYNILLTMQYFLPFDQVKRNGHFDTSNVITIKRTNQENEKIPKKKKSQKLIIS